MAAEVEKVRFKLTYGGSRGSYTFSRLKTEAELQDIYDTAVAFGQLQATTPEKIYMIEDAVITE